MSCPGLPVPRINFGKWHRILDCLSRVQIIARGVAPGYIAVILSRSLIKVRKSMASIIDKQPLVWHVPFAQKELAHPVAKLRHSWVLHSFHCLEIGCEARFEGLQIIPDAHQLVPAARIARLHQLAEHGRGVAKPSGYPRESAAGAVCRCPIRIELSRCLSAHLLLGAFSRLFGACGFRC